VVAEGVERAEQRDALYAAGCGLIQGYLFSKPVSADELSRMLTSGGHLGPAATDLASRGRFAVLRLATATPSSADPTVAGEPVEETA